MPFISDYFYKDLTGKESVHLESWPEISKEFDKKVIAEMELVREVASLGNAARKQINIPVRQPLKALAVKINNKSSSIVSNEITELTDNGLNLLKEELNIKNIDQSLIDKLSIYPDFIKKFESQSGTVNLLLDLEMTAELKKGRFG